jgi:hypothetical protein
MNFRYNPSLPLALQADDIAGAQFLYGVAQTSSVPEPPTFGLLLVALGSAVPAHWMRRRRLPSSVIKPIQG